MTKTLNLFLVATCSQLKFPKMRLKKKRVQYIKISKENIRWVLYSLE